jgi:hypothetical protein
MILNPVPPTATSAKARSPSDPLPHSAPSSPHLAGSRNAGSGPSSITVDHDNAVTKKRGRQHHRLPYHSVRRVFPSTAARLACQVKPSCALLRLSLLPAYPSPHAVCRHPSCPPWRQVQPRSVSRTCARLSTAMRANISLYPRGPRSGPGYAVPVHHRLSAPSAPLTGTSRLPSPAGYTRRLRCAGAPRRPATGSVLSLRVPSRHVALYVPGELVDCLHPVPSSTTRAFACPIPMLGAPHSPTIRFRWAFVSGLPGSLRYDLPVCSPSWRI